MTILNQSQPIQRVAAHLMNSAGVRTKSDNGDPLEMLARKFGDHAATVMTKLGASNEDLIELRARMDEMEQKAARAGGGDFYRGAGGKSLGEQFVESDNFKTLRDIPEQSRKNHRADMIVKANITSLATDAAGSVGASVDAEFRPGPLLPMRQLAVRDLLRQVRISSGSVDVPMQKAFNNNAASVAEGVLKPQSDIQMELKNYPVRTLAHWMKASRQIIDDAPMVKDLIDSELMYGLKFVEDNQLLNGAGTGTDLNGIYTQATASTANLAVVQSPTKVDVIGIAMLQTALALYRPSGIVVHPSDFVSMLLLKDTAGAYLFNSPGNDVRPQLFGLPVVQSLAMTTGKFLVGDFENAATIFDRWDARVEMFFAEDDFVKNMVTILCEERLALAVTRPGALVKGDFAAQITDLTS